MELGVNGKRALVLGASRGLGMAIAGGLAAEGVQVFAAARGVDRIRDWASDMVNVTPVEMDLADRGSVDTVADALLASGGVDILVNNTGGPPACSVQAAGFDDWTTHFAVMAATLFHLTGRLVAPMREKGWGRIVTIASSGVEQPIPNLALSNAIRSSVVGWSKTLSNEIAADGITVNVVLPGRIQTDRLDQLDAAAAERTGKSVEEVARASVAMIPAGRYGTPEEFADMVVFLCSARAAYVTGSKIRIDGGAIRSV